MVDGWDPKPWVDAMRVAMPGDQVNRYSEIGDKKLVEYALVWAPGDGRLSEFSNLKAIFSLGAGVDHLLIDENLPDVPIARIVDPDLTSRMTEWIVSQVLFHHRQFNQYETLQLEAKWQELKQPAAHEVHIGIMGLGELGQASAQVLKLLGFKVNGWSRTAKTVMGITSYTGEEGFEAFLRDTDILVCLLPLTSQTMGMIDKTILGKLRKEGPLGGPFFINAGRGKIHVETDLFEALVDGTLKGASLDVFEVEPLSKSSPLWTLSNVTITPHVAAVSNPTILSRLIARQISAHSSGRALDHLVDVDRGY